MEKIETGHTNGPLKTITSKQELNPRQIVFTGIIPIEDEPRKGTVIPYRSEISSWFPYDLFFFGWSNSGYYVEFAPSVPSIVTGQEDLPENIIIASISSGSETKTGRITITQKIQGK